jgi:NAD-dependent dihydropyrimidine dehydrogenase PreA subunit
LAGLHYLNDVVTLELDAEKCNGCSLCLMVCPQAVFTLEPGLAIITNRDACIECGACQGNCPVEAISVRAGVGCASGIISSWLRGSDDISCDCSDDGPCC